MTMRVLHVDTGDEWRGGQRQLFLLSRGLRDLGYEPLVVTSPAAPLAARLRDSGLAVSTTPMRASWDLTAIRHIRKLLRTWSPDVVHAHDARAHALVLGALEGDVATPLVITRRTTAHPTPRGLELGHRIARYVAVSRQVRAALIAGGIDPVLIDVVTPGIEAIEGVDGRDWRAAAGWPGEAIVSGVVGTLAQEPGFETLVRIVERLDPRARDRTRLVLFTSEGPATLIAGVEAIRSAAADHGRKGLAGLDLLWHSSATHGLGTVVLDAMSLGIPPVAFATGPAADMIEHDVSGLLIGNGEEGAFAGAVSHLVLHDPARRNLAAGGPARAALFDARNMIKAHDRVYRSLTPTYRDVNAQDREG